MVTTMLKTLDVQPKWLAVIDGTLYWMATVNFEIRIKQQKSPMLDIENRMFSIVQRNSQYLGEQLKFSLFKCAT